MKKSSSDIFGPNN